jgi:hypothetical protein
MDAPVEGMPSFFIDKMYQWPECPDRQNAPISEMPLIFVDEMPWFAGSLS